MAKKKSFFEELDNINVQKGNNSTNTSVNVPVSSTNRKKSFFEQLDEIKTNTQNSTVKSLSNSNNSKPVSKWDFNRLWNSNVLSESEHLDYLKNNYKAKNEEEQNAVNQYIARQEFKMSTNDTKNKKQELDDYVNKYVEEHKNDSKYKNTPWMKEEDIKKELENKAKSSKEYNELYKNWESSQKETNRLDTVVKGHYFKQAGGQEITGNKVIDGILNTGINVGETAIDAGENILKGIFNFSEGVVDAGRYALSGATGKLGEWTNNEGLKNYSEGVKERAKQNTTEQIFNAVNKTIDPLNYLDERSYLSQRGEGVAQSVGYSSGYVAMSGLKALGFGDKAIQAMTNSATFTSSYGNAMSQAYEMGFDDKEANKYALINASVETLTENMFGGITNAANIGKVRGVSKGALDLDDKVAQKVSEVFKSRLGKNLNEYFIKANAEGMEELVGALLRPTAYKMFDLESTKDKTWLELFKDEHALESYIDGAISAGLSQIPGVARSIKTGTDYITNRTDNENKVIETESKNRQEEKAKELGRKLTKQEIEQINNQVESDLEKGRISVDTIEEALGDNYYKQYKDIKDKKSDIQNKIDEYKKMKDNDITVEQREEYNKLKEELSNIDEETYKNELSKYVDDLTQKDSYLRTSYDEKANRSVAFNADLSKYKGKQKEIVQKAIDSGVLNNTRRSHELVNLIAKLAEDKGMDFDFINNEKLKDSGFALEGKQVNGYNTGTSIGINIDSNKALNNVVGHEITHVLEGTNLYNELKNSITEYAKTKGEYDTRLAKIQELYKDVKDANVENELTSDLVGDYLFTDEDFVNRLYNNNRNVFQKIYDEIKYFIKQVVPGSKESKQLEQVKRAFEKAYNQNTINKASGIKYDIQENNIQTTSDANNDVQTKINQSMTMKDAKKMIDIAFKENQINDSMEDNEKYKDADDWLNKVGTDEVSMYVENGYSTIENYLNPLYERDNSFGEDYTLEDVIEAYQNGTLVGGEKQQANRLDLTKEFNIKDDRFYSPKTIDDINKVYDVANQRVTNSNREEVYKARGDFVILAHNQENVNKLGLNSKELNQTLKKWAAYPSSALELSNKLNDGVAYNNKWSGLENSSIMYNNSVSNEELSQMVKSIEGDSSGWQRKYITSTMLALDTHIDYKNLSFQFDKTAELAKENALGDYNRQNKTIRIGMGYQNTVAHEMGHYLDNKWAEDFGFLNNSNMTTGLNFETANVTDDVKQFAKNFKMFMDDLVKSATTGSGSNTSYYQSRSEIFARFVGRFVEWTKNTASGNKFGYDEKYYKENFTQSQYEEFVKLLQEKSMLDTTGQTYNKIETSNKGTEYSLSNQNEKIAPTGNYQIKGEDVKLAPVKETKTNVENKDISIPTKETIKPKENISIPINKQDNTLKETSKDIAEQINKNNNVDMKQRGWTKTAKESEALKGNKYVQDFDPSRLSYEVQTNKESLDKANKHIETYGYDKTLEYVKNLIQNDGLPKASDVALMQRMIQEASKRGDAETVQNLIMDTAILGTDLGQATQALSIIKKLTPEGQLKMYTKIVERAKTRGEKSFDNVEITPKMVENILGAYKEDGTYDQNDLNARVEEFKQDLANQMKTTAMEKIDAWRYLSMLGNPKTHIRNIVSNVAMKGTTKVKNAVARTLESVIPIKERTKTWKKASQEIKDYAKQTTQEMKDIITGEGKYNEKTSIEAKKQIFKNKALEKVSDLNSALLEYEDWMFSSSAFRSTFQEYLTANGINTMEDVKNNPKVVEKAKNYAVEQAQIATFRQYSKLAAVINQFEKKNKIGKFAIEALVPFKKTPINVAKTGVKYSPLGLIKNITYDAYQLKQGNINASQFIDNISQGMTGTSLTLLGYALTKAGILSGSGDDDKEGKYDKQLGETGYSVNIGGKSYSISWLSPVAMPLLVGSNAYEQLEEGKDWDMNIVSDSLAKTLDPLNEMSFMQGLTNALQSYGSGSDKLKGSLESTAQNYIGQFFPTLFSQIASVTDDTKRSTQPGKSSKYKFGEQTIRSVMYKVPGLRQQLEPTIDVWGNEKKQSENILERAFETFIAPYSTTNKISTDLDEELKRVYKQTGESKVIPSVPQAYLKYKDETYKMSANEYTEYKKTYGQKASKYLDDLINTSSYKNASNDDKVKMIDQMYDYAKAEANEKYFKNEKINYTSKTLEELNELKDIGINNKTLAQYTADKSQISTIKSDSELSKEDKKTKSKNIFMNSNLNDKLLSYLYGKFYSSKETLNNMLNAGIPTKQFIKFDLQDFEGEFDENKGKVKTNSKKNEVINYVNNLNLSVPQKAFLIRSKYSSFKQYDNQIEQYIQNRNISLMDKYKLIKEANINDYDSEIVNYVNKQKMSVSEKQKLLKSMGFTINNGRVYYK